MFQWYRYGIGVDVVSIPRVVKLIERWGNRFIKRVFTDNEIAYCFSHPAPAASFAARFAAKEAFFKALAPQRFHSITHRSVEVVVGERGEPVLVLHGGARAALGSRRGLVTISHESDIAVGMVLIVPEALS